MADDNRKNDKVWYAIGFVANVGSWAFLAVMSYLVYADIIVLNGKTQPSDLSDFQGKLKFTFRYAHPSIAFIVFMVLNVILKRVFSDKNPLNVLDPQAQNQRNQKIVSANSILQNCCEQFLICVFSQLALIGYLNETETLKVIPLVNTLHLIGRVTFWLGYPKLRMFGLIVTFGTNVAAVGFAMYKFVVEQF